MEQAAAHFGDMESSYRNGVHIPSYYDPEFGLHGEMNESDSLFPNLNDTVKVVANVTRYMSSLGVWLAIPEWEAAVTAITLSLIIVLTVVGNILVILSVFTYRPLRSAPNFFIVSLAVADLTVAVLVLPLNVAYTILGRWVLGKLICEFWVTSDVLCCTASILHLCAIALDRYRAITDPVNYARKRTLHRVLITIAVVWIMSFIISSPPLLGWNDWPANFDENTPCILTRQRGYVVYSALGSFFIPLLLMTAVYIRIFIATRRRLRQRARASRLSAMAKKSTDCGGKKNDGDRDRSSISSIENNGNDGSGDHCLQKSNDSINQQKQRNRSAKHGNKGNHAATTAIIAGGGVSPAVGGEVVEPANKSSNSNASSEGILSVRIQGQLNADEAGPDGTKLSPANLSEESVTDAEIPLHQHRPHSHSVRGEGGHGKSSHSSRGSKKPGRQTSQQVSQFVEEKQRISLSKERKAARTLGIIMGVFVVCWLPFFLMYVIVPFCSSCEPGEKLVNAITWLGYVNSSLNPIIYTIFNMDFRKAFKKLLHLGK
ncbi:probable G-protein coupled receptor No18 [Folsomia candida]|uniref:probable G-protein coupled receptor No18 n=1 Tax=Folsomia candida TaxID=158441 RepID=UPI001604CF7F|nr:probable G-protein coupled receptor No18 [Folsomia candida]XP_035714439.1 probable G-protein coupled receptor No18 [Folsomia candida]